MIGFRSFRGRPGVRWPSRLKRARCIFGRSERAHDVMVKGSLFCGLTTLQNITLVCLGFKHRFHLWDAVV